MSLVSVFDLHLAVIPTYCVLVQEMRIGMYFPKSAESIAIRLLLGREK